MDLIELNPHATVFIFLKPVPANKMQLFIHDTAPYINVHPRLDSRIGPKFSDHW